MKVLVVDDNVAGRKLLRYDAEQRGHEVVEACDGREGLELAKKYKPELIISDAMMPNMDGFEFLREIKKNELLKNIPFIFYSAVYTGNKEQELAVSLGAKFIVKPKESDELWEEIRPVIEEGRLKKEIVAKILEEDEEFLRRYAHIVAAKLAAKVDELAAEITERKRMEEDLKVKNLELEKAYSELKEAEAKIIQQEKMASIGQLAAGVAHEINNPICFVSSNIETLKKYASNLVDFLDAQTVVIAASAKTEDIAALGSKRKKLNIDTITSDITKLIEESLDGAGRVQKIANDLRTFSRIDETDFKMADINSGIESTLNIVWNELKYKAVVTKELGDIPPVKCNIGKLAQVFMNILINAAHAIDKQGEIKIKTWSDLKNIYIAISDTGSGIPEANISRIFEPFFTTKEAGIGTGLGLSVAHDIIKQHKGEIKVESTTGKGTTFIIEIPLTEEG